MEKFGESMSIKASHIATSYKKCNVMRLKPKISIKYLLRTTDIIKRIIRNGYGFIEFYINQNIERDCSPMVLYFWWRNKIS